MSTAKRISERRRSGSIVRRDRPTSDRLFGSRARVSPRLELLEDRTLLSSFAVTNTSDYDIPGSLRHAIDEVNSSSDASNKITFELPAGDTTIYPGLQGQGALPAIEKPVQIDGSQPGFNGAPVIQILGFDAGTNAYGLDLESTASGSVIDDLVIGGFGNAAIYILSSHITVYGNYLGTNLAGGTADPNRVGVEVDGSQNTIGDSMRPNVISGNTSDGILVGGSSCTIQGNLIGTNAAGTGAVPNNGDGIFVDAIASATIDGNVISGNGQDGIAIYPIVGSGGVVSCLVEGNLIGTNAAGTALVPNDNDGIIFGPSDTGVIIGGTDAGDGNLISGNLVDGIDIDGPCLVEGNQIGTNLAGSGPLANNADGIRVLVSGATIGGTSTAARNVISGNGSTGVDAQAPCLIEGNMVGIDATGRFGVANNDGGILADSTGVTIGGTSVGAGNLISGNKGDGVVVDLPCLIEGNLIGTNATGTSAVPNSPAGLDVIASDVTIGGTSSGAGNVISGNSGDGIDITGFSNLVEGNSIGVDLAGTDPLGNKGDGVKLTSYFASGNQVGADGSGNIVAFNGGAGVAYLLFISGDPIRFNSIFSNTGPGIDLGDNGVTPNTSNRTDNSPVIAWAGNATIEGSLNATPNSTYTIDFYANRSSDGSPARPQGRDYLGTMSVATNGQGNAVFDFPYSPIDGEPFVTATSTDLSGRTSEFSAPVAYAITASGLTFGASAGLSFQGTVATFTSTDLAATSADFTAAINYGDGTAISAGTVLPAPGGFIVVGSHTFKAANPDTAVTVTITDTLGSYGQATANSLADVVEPGGLVTSFGQSVEFVAGTLFSRTVASFSDSSPQAIAGEFTATIAWGDGTANSVGVVTAAGAGFIVAGSHTFNFANTYPVIVTINDSANGGVTTANSTAMVDPVPITIQNRNFAVTGKKNFSGTVATFIDGDPRIDPTFYTATIYWTPGVPGTAGVITGTNPFTVTGSHTFPTFQNTEIVTIVITDKNGRTVTGVDRVVDPPGVLDIEAGGLALSRNRAFDGVVAAFTDSGPTEATSAYKATINWGKGRKSAGMITGSNGQFIIAAKHVFPRFSGFKPVTITVTDSEGRTVTLTESASYIARKPQPKSAAKSDR
jgi:hypothetical protein